MQTITTARHDTREIKLTPMLTNGPASSYTFGPGNVLTMHAVRTPQRKAQAMGLLRNAHACKGYDTSRSATTDEFDTVPGTLTFLVTKCGEPVATLRVIPDSAFGLPADKIFPDKMLSLRQRGRRACEIASMALYGIDPRESLMILMELFRLAWWMARYVLDATDMVASAMAHHQHFYRRLLLFDEADSASRTSPRTGCDVCFCRLDVDKAEVRYRARYGKLKGPRNLFRFFVEDDRVPELLMWLFSQHNLPDTLAGIVPLQSSRKGASCSVSIQPLPATLAS